MIRQLTNIIDNIYFKTKHFRSEEEDDAWWFDFYGMDQHVHMIHSVVETLKGTDTGAQGQHRELCEITLEAYQLMARMVDMRLRYMLRKAGVFDRLQCVKDINGQESKYLGDGKVASITKPNICQSSCEHPDILSSYCQTCCLFLCVSCDKMEHAMHSVVSITAEYRKRLERLVEIKESISEVIEEASKRESTMLDSLKSVRVHSTHMSNKETYTMLKRTIISQTQQFKHFMRNTEEKIEQLRQIIAVKDHIKAKLKADVSSDFTPNITKSDNQGPPLMSANITLNLDIADEEHAIFNMFNGQKEFVEATLRKYGLVLSSIEEGSIIIRVIGTAEHITELGNSSVISHLVENLVQLFPGQITLQHVNVHAKYEYNINAKNVYYQSGGQNTIIKKGEESTDEQTRASTSGIQYEPKDARFIFESPKSAVLTEVLQCLSLHIVSNCVTIEINPGRIEVQFKKTMYGVMKSIIDNPTIQNFVLQKDLDIQIDINFYKTDNHVSIFNLVTPLTETNSNAQESQTEDEVLLQELKSITIDNAPGVKQQPHVRTGSMTTNVQFGKLNTMTSNNTKALETGEDRNSSDSRSIVCGEDVKEERNVDEESNQAASQDMSKLRHSNEYVSTAKDNELENIENFKSLNTEPGREVNSESLNNSEKGESFDNTKRSTQNPQLENNNNEKCRQYKSENKPVPEENKGQNIADSLVERQADETEN
ncbi:uncharacterized protein LOC121367911 isoform X2 [Gigantopelta aegis]|uniref:uncharacterized protein LOC121367911 isoform X2 n=1 Tax=Gigantopelta aegis TaxID=1735272 RepID=UPI001B889AB2|nr:uncharacterized protein LOC121367911 isoform X2 [Gigantopelta aegis]